MADSLVAPAIELVKSFHPKPTAMIVVLNDIQRLTAA
jgi:hypothetical protein